MPIKRSYTVKRNQTALDIALELGLSSQQLLQANPGISTFKPGVVLTVPKAPAGPGIAPLNAILRKLSDKAYAGPLSVELFLPKFQKGDPFEVAREIRQKAEPVMRQAGVL